MILHGSTYYSYSDNYFFSFFLFPSGEKDPERPWSASPLLRAVVRPFSPDLRPSETLSVRQSNLCTVSFAGIRQMSVVSMKQT